MNRTPELYRPPGETRLASTCYMCACRCGIHVHLRDGKVSYIEGNPEHPVNRGVLCGKGSAGLKQHLSPARLRAPLKRVGPRGQGQFEEISWDEALSIACDWLGQVRLDDPKRLAFFTGRDQSQSLTGWWAQQFGTPNFAAHGGFCSVNMATAGMYTFGGSFWEFGEPDFERCRYFMLFGVAEDHASNPMKIGLGKLKARGVKCVAINPVRTGYNAIADEWVGIRPGTDGLFVSALIHVLLDQRQIDLNYLSRYTNAPWLLIDDPGAADDGLFARDDQGRALVHDANTQHCLSWQDCETPALHGTVTLPDGRRGITVLTRLAERYLDDAHAPEHVAQQIGIGAEQIRRIAAEIAHAAFEEEIVLDQPWTDWRGVRHEQVIGRPVAMHAMRGISAHVNGFQTCRMIHLLQILLGSIDCPGGYRYKPPYPKEVPPAVRPTAGSFPETPLPGPHLGYPIGPEDLLLDQGQPARIDKAFSWEAPISTHGLMHTVLNNAATEDPYRIEVLFMYMANVAWNSSMNVASAIDHLTATDEQGRYRIERFIYSDAYYSETVAYADLVLPDTTYLERWDCISLLDRPISDADHAADAIRQPVVQPDRDVRPFQEVLLDLGARLKLPGMVNADGSARYPGGYADYMVNHVRKPGIGPLAGWRGEHGDEFGIGAVNPDQLRCYVNNNAFHSTPLPEAARWNRFANLDYLQWAVQQGFKDNTEPLIMQLYLEPVQKFALAARGHGERQPPERLRQRILDHFDPLPRWSDISDIDSAEYPLHAITQRPMHMYHSWGSQNAWLRQITAQNRLYIHHSVAERIGARDDDWVWVRSPQGRVKCQIRCMSGVNPETVWTWNAIGKRAGAWGLDPDSPEFKEAFLLNHLIAELLPADASGLRCSNSDPITGQAAWFDLRVAISLAEPNLGPTVPCFEPVHAPALTGVKPT